MISIIYDLKPDTQLMVTILPSRDYDSERENWMLLSARELERAYGDNEPEYTSDLIKEVNPDYEAR